MAIRPKKNAVRGRFYLTFPQKSDQEVDREKRRRI